MVKARPALERFRQLLTIDHATDCHIWHGGRKTLFRPNGRASPGRSAKVWIWEQEHGVISPGMLVVRTCLQPLCMNPAHMRVVDRKGLRLHAECEQGHPLIGENLCILRSGERRCRQCANDRYHRYNQRTQARLSADPVKEG